jgi:glycosyltransferase involved in cell wall biosynthesis
MKFISTMSASYKKKYFRYFRFHPVSQLKKIWQLVKDALCIARSGLFDSAWYLKQYKDIADAGINPLIHYLRHGAYEGRDPNPLFDSDWYLRKNPEVADAGDNPLTNYIHHGVRLKRNPSAYFDADWYISQYSDVANLHMHPLRHYLKYGAAAGNRPAPYESALRRWMKGNSKDNRPKLLIIDQSCPQPDQDSGSLDCVNYIKIFQEFGYRVFFASIEEYNLDPEIYKPLEERNVLCLNPVDYLTIDAFIEKEIESFSAVFLSRVFSGGRYFESIRNRNSKIKIIFNPVDLHAIREEREGRLFADSDTLRRASKTSGREIYLAGRCDATIVVSEYEKQYLEAKIPNGEIYHVPLMRDCPGRRKEFPDRDGVCFIGNYRHSPNIDALKYFLDCIWPLILDKHSGCKFYVIGSGPPEDLKNSENQNVIVLGHVPDLREWLNRIKVSVAPLRYGAGAKGKIVTSLANGLPCVATDAAIEGMGLTKGQHLIVENNPGDFADRVVELCENRDLWTEFSDKGWRFCAENFSHERGRGRMTELFENLGLPVSRN